MLDRKYPEVWVRWYMRYQAGYRWNPLIYDKAIYFHGDSSPVAGWFNGALGVAQLPIPSNGTFTWESLMGGPGSDGQWHLYEVHLKTDTGQNDGIVEFWVDQIKRYSHQNVNIGGGAGWDIIEIGSNQGTPSNGGCMYLDFDDVAIRTTGPIGPVGSAGGPPPATTLFEELFEDGNLAARGWYDNANPVLSSVEHIAGSTRSVEFRWTVGAPNPINGGAMRHKFTETDAVYLSYWVKYSSNYTGSNQPYHPHEFYFLTNLNGDFDGLSWDYLTAYVEHNEGFPTILIQDGTNISTANINVNLVGVTENRAVAGCNGDSDGYGNGSCYTGGGLWFNGKTLWRDSVQHFSDAAGAFYKNNWHHVEVYLKLNTIVGGIGQANGIVRYWYDGTQLLNRTNHVFRTGQRPTMKFNQLVIAPWIGDGSPIDQTFWIDNLTVGTAPPSGEDTNPPAAPTNLQIN